MSPWASRAAPSSNDLCSLKRVWALPPPLNLLLGSFSSPRNNLEMSEPLGRSFLTFSTFIHTQVVSHVIFLGSDSVCFRNVSSPKDLSQVGFTSRGQEDGGICSVALNLTSL